MPENDYMSSKQVSEEFPMFTPEHLATLRYTGRGPVFLKPTPRTVIYRRADVIAWLEASERTSTAEVP